MRISDWSSEVCSSDLAIVLSANDPVHGLAKLQDRAETGDRIDADARAGKRARFPCLAIIVTNVVKPPFDVDTFTHLIIKPTKPLLNNNPNINQTSHIFKTTEHTTGVEKDCRTYRISSAAG